MTLLRMHFSGRSKKKRKRIAKMRNPSQTNKSSTLIKSSKTKMTKKRR